MSNKGYVQKNHIVCLFVNILSFQGQNHCLEASKRADKVAGAIRKSITEYGDLRGRQAHRPESTHSSTHVT